MSQRLFYIHYIWPRQDCQACFGGFCYIFSTYKMQYVFKSVFTKSKRAQEPTFLRSFFLVRKMGLEPTRHRHTHLKRACLPIPALPQIAFDCKKDSSTFGGIKSSPILQLFPAWGHLSKVSIYFYAQCQGLLKLYAHNRQSFLSRFVVSYETSSFT